MSAIGRPQVLNEEKKRTIIALLSVGCSRTTAAHYVNCDPKTIYNTARRDPDFDDGLAQAENGSEFIYLTRVRNAANEPRYWRSAAWALERMFPDRFGRRSPETITPQQLDSFMRRLTEMLVEEVPVARYRKQILARLELILNGDNRKPIAPASKGNRQKRDSKIIEIIEKTPLGLLPSP
jgi:hypothetical protein